MADSGFRFKGFRAQLGFTVQLGFRELGRLLASRALSVQSTLFMGRGCCSRCRASASGGVKEKVSGFLSIAAMPFSTLTALASQKSCHYCSARFISGTFNVLRFKEPTRLRLKVPQSSIST